MPTADGKGTAGTGNKTPVESVDVKVRTDTPGGESASGSQIKMEGPNSAKKGKK